MRRIQYARILRALLYILYIVSRARVRSQEKRLTFLSGKNIISFTLEKSRIGSIDIMTENFIKIDPHVHSNEISRCSHVTCEQIIDQKIELGYKGAVLTNHCQEWYYPEEEHKNYIEQVIEDFNRGKAYADKKGFRFYLGLEVSLHEPHYADWLLYGVTEEFLRKTPCLYKLSQKELFQLCEENGVLLVQAHPFRQSPCDPNFMHGVEINCSDGDLDKIPLVEEFASRHDLFVTCGTDYHFIERTYHGGIYLPDTCQTAADIAAYIRKTGEVRAFYGGKDKIYRTSRFLKR